jgi:hypothetical protein
VCSASPTSTAPLAMSPQSATSFRPSSPAHKRSPPTSVASAVTATPVRRSLDIRAASSDRKHGLFKYFEPVSRSEFLEATRKEDILLRDEWEDKSRQCSQDEIMTKHEKQERVRMLARERKRMQRLCEKVCHSDHHGHSESLIPV